MNDFLMVLLYSSIPFVANFTGGLISEFTSVDKRRLSIALHFAAGIVIGVVSLEIMPKVVQAKPFWPVVIAYILGVLFSLGTDRLIKKLKGGKEASAISIYIAVCIDLLSDGLVISSGSTISRNFGGILAIGQSLADGPEGYATIASLNNAKVQRKKRVIMNLSLIFPTIIGASIGYWALKGSPEYLKLSFLSFTAAILVKAAVEEMIGSAHEIYRKGSIQVVFFLAGFLLFTLVSVYF